ncbi:MAG TPA: molybdate ABC transporter substrate-binding protein [Solirubrobacteraceae bacterium]|nr:molybdate ABC transporter substrate-binding protein [Solirubrobacteraceae bacterium]
MRRLLIIALLLGALAGCGDDDDAGSGNGELVVSAAASLTDALTECSADNVKLSFGGSDELAAQIRQGVKPDVFASANTKLPDELYSDKLVQKPVTFVTNELIIAVPDDSEIGSIEDLADRGVKLVIGAETVPVGSYTRQLLSKLPADQEEKILANVRSEEPDVKGVVGKLTQGAADAGFIYRTDLTDGLKAVTLPEDLQPVVEYGAAVVKASDAAQEYLDGLTEGKCADALQNAGFGKP